MSSVGETLDGRAQPGLVTQCFGHAGGNSMWGAAATFTPRDFDPEEPKQSFSFAQASLFPRRCWFTRNATARSG